MDESPEAMRRKVETWILRGRARSESVAGNRTLMCRQKKRMLNICAAAHGAWEASQMKKLFAQYRGGKGTLVISFNDGTTITGEFVNESDGFLEITGQVNAIAQTCYVPYPNENIKYMYWKDPEAPT